MTGLIPHGKKLTLALYMCQAMLTSDKNDIYDAWVDR